MKDSREIIQKKVESVEIERPFEHQLPTNNGGYGAYRELNAPDGFQLADYWRAIRKRLWLVIGITVLLTTLAAIYMARKPDIYQANAVVQVDLEQNNQDLAMNDRRSPVSNQDPSYFNTQLQLLWSDTLLRRVIKDLSLDSNKEFQKAKTEDSVSTWRALLKAIGLASDIKKKEVKGVDEVSVSASTTLASSEEIAEAARLAPYIKIIKKDFGVEPRRESRVAFKETRLIDITYKHTDPEFAALIINGIAEVFAKSNQEKRSGTSRKTNDFLQERVAQLQSEIKSGENKLFELTKTAGILKTDNEQTIVLDRLSGLNKQLLEAENERKNAEAKYQALNDSPERLRAQTEVEMVRFITERDNAIRQLVSDTQKKISDLNATRAKALEEYLDTAPEVREYDRQIKSLSDDIAKVTEKNQRELEEFRRKTSQDILNTLKTKYCRRK